MWSANNKSPVLSQDSNHPAGETITPVAPLVSVIIPALNEEGIIDRLLTDLILTATPEIEIIVADSCSTDNTPTIVEALARAHPTLVKLVRAPIKGVSLARNLGAAAAGGRYLVFLDADARITSSALLHGVAEMEQRNLVSAALRFISGSEFWGDQLIAKSFNLTMGMLQYVAPTAPGSAGYLIRRDAHKLYGGFNESMHFGEDIEYLRRVSQGARFRFLKQDRIMLDMRRFQNEGRFKVLWKLCYGTLVQMVNPVIAKVPFGYETGHHLSEHNKSSAAQTNQPAEIPPRVLASAYKVIGRRRRLIPAEIASTRHLRKRPDGQVDMVTVLRERGDQITPYCLDDRRRCLILVETPKSVDLLTVDPFFYEAQRDHATQVYAVAYSDVARLANVILPAAQAPNPVFLHSTGRCGSTLLSQLLATTGNVQSVSEPDFYSQTVVLSRLADGRRDQELRTLMDGCTRLLCYNLRCKDPSATLPLIKLRSWCIFTAALFEPLSGRWRNLFLHRDPMPTINSFLNVYFSQRVYGLWRYWKLDKLLLSSLGALPYAAKALGATVPLFNHSDFRRAGRASAAGYFALQWMSHMGAAAKLQNQRNGFFSMLIRYEDALAHPLDQLRSLLSALGENTDQLPSTEELSAVLSRNSQAGSRMQSKGEYLLSGQDEIRVGELLKCHPITLKERLRSTTPPNKEAPAHAKASPI